jgi:hypothetical protein
VLRNIYLITSGLFLAVYAYMGLTGYEIGSAPRETMEPSVRHSPGHHFSYWHLGPHGGK